MARIHLIAQGKGGVGKSYVAWLLAQYLQERDYKTLLIDTDPVNHTFASVKSLGVEYFDITDGDDVDQRLFDDLFARVLECDTDTEVVIDNGSSSYVSLMSYLIANETVSQLQELGHEVYIHSLIVGGRDMSETLGNFDEMATKLPSAKMVVWLNHQIAGDVAHKGKSVRDSKTISKYNGQIRTILDLPRRKERLFGEDIRNLMAAHQTFAEGLENADFTVFSRQRLKIVQRETFARLDDSGLLSRLLPPPETETEGA